jgi:hypothetical protein
MQILHFELKLCKWHKTILEVQMLGFIGTKHNLHFLKDFVFSWTIF